MVLRRQHKIQTSLDNQAREIETPIRFRGQSLSWIENVSRPRRGEQSQKLFRNEVSLNNLLGRPIHSLQIQTGNRLAVLIQQQLAATVEISARTASRNLDGDLFRRIIGA